MVQFPNEEDDIECLNVNFRAINEVWGTNLCTKIKSNFPGCPKGTVSLSILNGDERTGVGIMVLSRERDNPGEFFIYLEEDGGEALAYTSRVYHSMTSVCCLAFAVIVEQSLGGDSILSEEEV